MHSTKFINTAMLLQVSNENCSKEDIFPGEKISLWKFHKKTNNGSWKPENYRKEIKFRY